VARHGAGDGVVDGLGPDHEPEDERRQPREEDGDHQRGHEAAEHGHPPRAPAVRDVPPHRRRRRHCYCRMLLYVVTLQLLRLRGAWTGRGCRRGFV